MSITQFPALAGSTESTLSAPWYMQVARGLVPGASVVNVFAYNASVGTTPIAIWELSNVPTQYVFPTTAQQLSIFSTSAADTSAKSILITGLDSGYNPISEVKTLNGTTPVTSVNSYLRVNAVAMTNALNTGTISLTSSSPSAGTVVARINAAAGRTQMGIYTVPLGYSLYGNRFSAFSSESGGGGSFSTFSARSSNAITGQQFTILQTPYANTYNIQRTAPLIYPQQTDVQWLGNAGTGTAQISVNIEAVLIANTAA